MTNSIPVKVCFFFLRMCFRGMAMHSSKHDWSENVQEFYINLDHKFACQFILRAILYFFSKSFFYSPDCFMLSSHSLVSVIACTRWIADLHMPGSQHRSFYSPWQSKAKSDLAPRLNRWLIHIIGWCQGFNLKPPKLSIDLVQSLISPPTLAKEQKTYVNCIFPSISSSRLVEPSAFVFLTAKCF